MPLEVEVPAFISRNAERGLRYVSEGKGGDGMTDKTIREARDMVNGRISKDKVRRMGPWFARHRVDMDAPANDPDNDAFPGKGAVAWLVWGGSTSGDILDAAKWAERVTERLDREEEQARSLDSFSRVANMDTIESKLAAALSGIEAKDAEVTEARAAVEKVAAENIELTAKVKELTVALDGILAEKAELAKKLDAAAANAVTASEEAAKIAAAVGVAPVESAPVASEPAPAKTVLEQYLALSGAERNAFFKAHKAAIMASLR